MFIYLILNFIGRLSVIQHVSWVGTEMEAISRPLMRDILSIVSLVIKIFSSKTHNGTKQNFITFIFQGMDIMMKNIKQ